MQAYFARVRNDSPAYHPNRYFYTLLPDGLASFNLSWDAKVTRDEWSSCVNFGVSDSNLKGINGGIGQNICVNFGQSDVGRWFAIDASGASGEAHAEGPYNAWSVNTWYTCDLVYNAHTSTARLTLEETGAKTLICTVNLLVPGGFTSDLKYLGGSRNRAGDSGYVGWSQWAVDEAYIDNVVLQTPEPATLSLLALGGLALLRRRGRIATRPV